MSPLKRGAKPTVLPKDWISAALHQIRSRGTLDVRIDSIADDLGMTKGSFYNYFDSRDELIQKALELWRDQEFNSVVAEKNAFRDPIQMIRGSFEFVRNEPNALLAFLCTLPNDSPYRSWIPKIMNPRFEMGCRTLRENGVPEHLVQPLMIFLISVFAGMGHMSSSGAFTLPSVSLSADEIWNRARELTESAFRALVTPSR